jgi:hypothetical protein
LVPLAEGSETRQAARRATLTDRSVDRQSVLRFLFGDDGLAEYAVAGAVCLRGLGLVYAMAFASLGVQARGLYGPAGILPVSELLDAAREHFGSGVWLELPTLFLATGAGDAALVAVCAAGACSGLALGCGVAPRLTAALCWALYLSWLHVGRVFLGFQWDALLLETGLLAIALAPPLRAGLRPPLTRGATPSPAVLFLLRWLCFRLFLLSGLVKLLSGDPAWRDLSAMSFHYWTQPLPNPLSPFAHALPDAIHRLETLATFGVELVAPWLALGPRGARRLAAAGFAGLLLVINASGNYGFFGPLALVLCIPLVDDAIWRRMPWLRSLPPAAPRRSPTAARRALGAVAVALVLVLTTGAALRRLGVELPAAWSELLRRAGPLGSFHAYGLFAVMTKDRPEIELEASDDGVRWSAYEFRWKPDRVEDPPALVAPHMPRLDWQLWFAALGECRSTPWFVAFLRRLLEAEPRVLALLARDPLDAARPRYVRSTLYRYRFADTETRRATGAWWVRERLRPYCPTLELVGDELRAVAP